MIVDKQEVQEPHEDFGLTTQKSIHNQDQPKKPATKTLILGNTTKKVVNKDTFEKPKDTK